MKITLLTYGSRGDVQPFVALARALTARGHLVRLAGPHRFADFAAGQKVSFVPLAGDPEEISLRINAAGANAVRMVRGMRTYVHSIAADVARAAFQACEGADLIVHSFLFTTGAHSLARQMGIADISVQLFPMFLPTREFPNVALPGLPAGALSYLSHWLANQVFWHAGNSGYRGLQQQFPQLMPSRLYWPFEKRREAGRTRLLGAWSPTVLPRPRDWPEGSIEITGYWFLDSEQDYQPPAQLSDFLAAGSAPVCVSFGSMIHKQAEQIQAETMRAISQAGARAVVLTGWQPWDAAPHPQILFLAEAPHAWLFPRCQAVIHHGGAGTTAAVARAGIASIAVPFAADQLFWARRLYALGVAPKPVRVDRVSSAWLVEALEQVQGQAIRDRARWLGQELGEEDGLARAVQVIEAVCGGSSRIF